MIHLVFGGTSSDRDFQAWTRRTEIKYVKTFEGMASGSLGKFATACISSALPLVKKNYLGDVETVGVQNDSLLVHFPESYILEDSEKVVDKARVFYALALDLGLSCKLIEYKSHRCVEGISSFIE